MCSDVQRPSAIVVVGSYSFDEILDPIAGELTEWCWWISVQGSPIESRWLHASDNNFELVEKLAIRVPEFENHDTTAFGRLFVPHLYRHIRIDEWSYFYTSQMSVDVDRHLVQTSIAFERGVSANRTLSGDFLTLLSDCDDLFLMHVDGWWEIYTTNARWRECWLMTFPDAFIRSWKRAGKCP